MGSSTSSLGSSSSPTNSDTALLTLSLVNKGHETCSWVTYYSPKTIGASSTSSIKTSGCWLPQSMPTCVYYNTEGTSTSCVPWSQATMTPGFGMPATSASAGSPASNAATPSATAGGSGIVVTAATTSTPSGLGPASCSWTSVLETWGAYLDVPQTVVTDWQCWKGTLEYDDWSPLTPVSCSKWYTFWDKPSTSGYKTVYKMTSTCDTRTEDFTGTTTISFRTDTMISEVTSSTSTLTTTKTTSIPVTSRMRSGKPSATASSGPDSTEIYIDLSDKVIGNLFDEVSHRLCLPKNDNTGDTIDCGDTLAPWGVEEMKNSLALDINGIDTTNFDRKSNALDPRIMANPELQEYVLTEAMGRSFANNFTNGREIYNRVRIDPKDLEDVQREELEEMDNPQLEAPRYKIICDWKQPSTTMDAQEVAAMTSYYQNFFSASFPPPITTMVCTPALPGHGASMVCNCHSKSSTSTFPILSRTDKVITEAGSTLTIDDFCHYTSWPSSIKTTPSPTPTSTIPALVPLSGTITIGQGTPIKCNPEATGAFNIPRLFDAATALYNSMSSSRLAATSTKAGAAPSLRPDSKWGGYYAAHYDIQSNKGNINLVLEVQYDETACKHRSNSKGNGLGAQAKLEFFSYEIDRFVDNFVWFAIEAQCPVVEKSNVGCRCILAGAWC